MELFIRIKDGQPFEHPILGDNFREAFPHVDVNNLPPDFARFQRVAPPVWGPYDKNQTAVYERGADGIYRDVWTCEKMTEDEIKAKQDLIKKNWAENPHSPKSWVFKEELCGFVPPIPYPTTGLSYYWNEELQIWDMVKEPVAGG